MSRIRKHLTYANVISTLTLFLVLGGGTALAAYVVSSNGQVAPGTISGHKPPSGKHANIIAGSINGQDIADRSGVDTCQAPLLGKFGAICAGSDAVAREWNTAMKYCSDFGLRLPSISEAVTAARNYDVPGVSGTQYFWTDEQVITGGGIYAYAVNENGASVIEQVGVADEQTVCVTDPSA
jgi:hypothetical protein